MSKELMPIQKDAILRAVPMELVLKHKKQAHLNHGQSVHKLAARGGLSIQELAAILQDKPFSVGMTESVSRVIIVIHLFGSGSVDPDALC